jgi:hypothetical protein
MGTERYPVEDQLITAVTVNGGNASVMAGKVMVSKERGIVVRFESDSVLPTRGQPITLLYGGGERVLRLRTTVAEIIDTYKLLLEPTGPVTEGERREFLRTDVALDVRAEVVGPDYVLPGEHHSPVGQPGWERQMVDLSGSGVSFLWDGLCRKGDLTFVQMALPVGHSPLINSIGEVVRASHDPESGKQRVAVHFTALDERDRDVLINFVFRRYYEHLGSSLGAVIDPDL